MIPAEWVRPSERRLTAEQVKRMEPGSRVVVYSADRYGEKTELVCTVACSGKKKVLVYRDRATWEIIVKPIVNKDNVLYVLRKEG